MSARNADSKTQRMLMALRRASEKKAEIDANNTKSLNNGQCSIGWEAGPDVTRHMRATKDADTQYAEKFKKEFKGFIEEKKIGEEYKKEEQHVFDNMGSDNEEEDDFDEGSVNRIAPNHGGGLDYYINYKPESVPDIEGVSTIAAPMELRHEFVNPAMELAQIRLDYFGTQYRKNKIYQELAVICRRDQILSAIKGYNVVIVQGNTGCGKTTQVPQFILEDAILNQKQAVNIVCTQPRKIAARSVAQRVCQENGWELGTIVGYQVGLDKVTSDSTMLTYCTTGVLLEKIISEKSLKAYSHIIVDEVHERDVDTDLLIMLIRWYMKKEATSFHLLIMSATMDIEKLTSYFQFKTTYGHKNYNHSVVIKIPTNSPIQNSVFYLNSLKLWDVDLILGRRPDFNIDEPEYMEYCVNAAAYLVNVVFRKLENQDKSTPAVLIFLPGLMEITCLEKMLKKNSSELDIMPLHSSLPNHEQQRVFEPPISGKRKVILSTNIAESSITLADIAYVIDFCLTKTMMKDQRTRYPILQLKWASKDRCTQRAGRAGRVMAGKVFRLIPEYFYATQFPDYAEPELLTAPLEHTVLRTKKSDVAPPIEQLGLMLDPPPIKEIRAAIIELKQMGALTTHMDGRLDRENGDVTELGNVICQLPIDVHLSKLIVMGFIFDCLDETIIIAACLSGKSIVRNSHYDELGDYRKRLSWASGAFSDLFVYLEAYREYRHHREFGKNRSFMRKWCDNEHLDLKKLEEVDILYCELCRRLSSLNIVVVEQPNRQRKADQDELMLKFVFCAAFYPNFFVSREIDKDLVIRMFHDSDPSRSVYLENIPQDQGPIYKNQIERELRSISDDPDIVFSGSRAVITLNDCDAPLGLADNNDHKRKSKCFVHESVYLAVKLGQSNGISIREFMPREARKRLEYYENKWKDQREKTNTLTSTRIKLVENNQSIKPRRINLVNWVPLSMKTLYIKVTNIVECCHFFGRIDDTKLRQLEDDLIEVINDTTFEKAINERALEQMVGSVAFAHHPNFVGKFKPGTRTILEGYHRIEIRSVPNPETRRIQVYFYDFGITCLLREDDIYIIPEDFEQRYQRLEKICSIPIIAVECKIHGIKPSPWATTWGGWSASAEIDFKDKLLNSNLDRRLEVKVFSCCDKILRLDITDNSIKDSRCDSNSMRQRLIIMGDGVSAEESDISLRDHKHRESIPEVLDNIGQDNDSDYIVEAFCEIERNAQNDQLDYEELRRLELDSNTNGRDMRRLDDNNSDKLNQDDPTSLFKSSYTTFKGPLSPIAMSFQGLSTKASKMHVRIERDSVNSVALDADYLDNCYQLMIAGSVNMSASGRIIARDTTLMPKIHGLPTIISLLFAPNYEFRINPHLSCLSGALFGLGCLESGESIDPENDIEINFDCLITKRDIDDINLCRKAMTELISKLHIENSGKPSGILQQGVRNSIMNLIRKRRFPLKEYIQTSDVASWKGGENSIMDISNPVLESQRFLPNISAPILDDSQLYKNIRQNLVHIDNIERKKEKMTIAGVKCLLCDSGQGRCYVSLVDLRNHLDSDRHIMRSQEFEVFEEFRRNQITTSR